MRQFQNPEMYFEEDYHITGFHGTDLNTAQQIIANGFDTDHGYETFFALSGDYETAIQHGQKNARRSDTDQFAVLSVSFPETPIYHTEYGGYVILEGDELRDVRLGSMVVYDTVNMGLVHEISFEQ